MRVVLWACPLTYHQLTLPWGIRHLRRTSEAEVPCSNDDGVRSLFANKDERSHWGIAREWIGDLGDRSRTVLIVNLSSYRIGWTCHWCTGLPSTKTTFRTLVNTWGSWSRIIFRCNNCWWTINLISFDIVFLFWCRSRTSVINNTDDEAKKQQ